MKAMNISANGRSTSANTTPDEKNCRTESRPVTCAASAPTLRGCRSSCRCNKWSNTCCDKRLSTAQDRLSRMRARIVFSAQSSTTTIAIPATSVVSVA